MVEYSRKKELKKFKDFLAEECGELQKYKDGKYDTKIYNYFMKYFIIKS
jgi:hypothetical protein